MSNTETVEIEEQRKIQAEMEKSSCLIEALRNEHGVAPAELSLVTCETMEQIALSQFGGKALGEIDTPEEANALLGATNSFLRQYYRESSVQLRLILAT